MISFLNKIISWSFYALFFLVPLAFTSDTSELFEFNKMWLTFGLTIIIVSAWICKMIFERRFKIQRTILDIPILLFLGSQLISTVISLDPHTSLWGYYSRFNGGFLSLLSYVLLYYAFVTHVADLKIQGVTEAASSAKALDAKRGLPSETLVKDGGERQDPGKRFIFRTLFFVILSGIIVSLWGLPSHFGYDPTCLVFRGNFDVSCWTANFQPKVRIFSTLGQPDWLSAYLGALIPLTIGLGLLAWKEQKKYLSLGLLATTLLFYLDFLFAKSRGGFLGLAVALVMLCGWYIWTEKKQLKKLFTKPRKLVMQYWYVLAALVGILLITSFVGTSFDQVDKFTLPSLIHTLTTKSQQTMKPSVSTPARNASASVAGGGELGGTDSGKIRLFVWQGALAAWMHYPIFGTGVETFAYAYYLFMPPGHNLTSEFGYLYNKAHNEYLNYLATTGIVGLGTYLIMAGWFLFVAIKRLLDTRSLKLDKETGSQKLASSSIQSQDSIIQLPSSSIQVLIVAFLASYLGILVTNFFGFSVVIINIFLFLIPAFVFVMNGKLDLEKSLSFPQVVNSKSSIVNRQSAVQWIFSGVISLVALYFLYTLIVWWNADKAYGLGQNYINANDYQNAYQPLHQAVQMRPSEPMFQDELALDDAVLAVALLQQDKTQMTTATQLAQEAVGVSNNLTTNHPNVVSYWKTRVRIMYSLAQLNPQYMQDALTAIQKAAQLAPTDAKVSYNLGLVLGQTGHVQEAVKVLENTIKLKKDYHDAYYALGIFYHSLGTNKNGVVTNDIYAQKAIFEMHFILDNFNNKDTQALAALKAWGAQ